MKQLPPLFEERPFWLQLVGAIVVPLVFGILTGLALGTQAVLFWIMAGPIAIIGGFLAGMEHPTADDGFVRGIIGGLVFGSFTLIGLEILNQEPETYLAEPQVGFVFATTILGALEGALGGHYRMRLERRQEAAVARG